MNKPIYVGLATGKTLRLIIALILLVLAGRAFNAHAQTVTNLCWFSGIDGGSPEFGLIQGRDGNFYGVTVGGATQDVCSGHCGTIFKITPDGSLTNLYWFSGSDGTSPSQLLQGSDGSFYGTTAYGGTSTNCPGGCGTVFRISPSGTFTSLYSFGGPAFVGPPNDGAIPYAGLVQGSDGNFYGTTSSGGTNGFGTVFRISPSGSFTNLYLLGVGNANPWGGLVQGNDGNFYGTTKAGGNGGTLFRISPGGSFTNLHWFGSKDGKEPVFSLVQGSDGNFYGTTGGGAAIEYGNVFRMSPSGSFTNLYYFSGSDGSKPNSVLVQGSDGNFYGTTAAGGTNGLQNGTIFRISPSGSFTNVYFFDGSVGNTPDGLVQGSDGNFYGTAYHGGSGPCNSGCGSVFELSIALIPPANQISGVQMTGDNIAISVPSVAYETYQLQFTTDLTFGTWSNLPGVSVTNSIGALLTLTNFGGASQPQGFYRFHITP